MANSKMKAVRMNSAKLAVAYLKGGENPFNAARKSGFTKVKDMEAAIAELACEEEVNLTDVPHVGMNEDKSLHGHEVLMDVKNTPKPAAEERLGTMPGGKNEATPMKTAKRGSFVASVFEATEDCYQRMVRLYGWNKRSFIMFAPDEVKDLHKVLDELTGCRERVDVSQAEPFPEAEKMGMQAEITRLHAECEKLRSSALAAEDKAKEWYAHAGNVDKLLFARDQEIEKLRNELAAQQVACEGADEAIKLREENRRLKDKLVDMIMQ